MGAESKLSSVRVDQISITHEDPRRAMTEIISDPGITLRDIKLLQIKQPEPGQTQVVGGHWEQGIEVQYVLDGEISLLRLADVETGDETRFENLGPGTRVYLPAGVAHELTFERATTLFVLNEIPFSPAKLVVYPPWAQRQSRVPTS